MDARLTIAYHGARFAGWQRQNNALAVQEVVEEALSGLAGTAVRVNGASRTDAGVHARGQVVSCSLPRALPASALVHGVNALLPPEVRVMAAAGVAPGFHARRCASAKEYRYRLLRAAVVSPLEADRWVRAKHDLDLAVLRDASAHLVGRHDFSAFALAGGGHRSPVRRIHLATWEESGDRLVFRVVGDGFLRGMVRALVGTLLEAGRGRRDAAGVRALLDGAPRSAAGPSAPAHGLTLERVFYPQQWGGPALATATRADSERKEQPWSTAPSTRPPES